MIIFLKPIPHNQGWLDLKNFTSASQEVRSGGKARGVWILFGYFQL